MSDNHYPQRKSPRLQGCDYAQEGAYFVTLCTHHRAHLFGEIVAGAMGLNRLGRIAESCWAEIPDHFPNVELDLYVIMPNHVHGIVIIADPCFGGRDISRPYGNDDGGGAAYMPSVMTRRPKLGTIIGTYKAAVTRIIHNPTIRIWQRGYHDHIIRNDPSLNKIREYILHNPALWREDTFYCDANA